jgi:hypothetical protein
VTVSTTMTPEPTTDKASGTSANKPNYHKVFTHWVRVGEGTNSKIHEIHTLDNRYVLYVKEDIKPSTIPISELYCNLPSNDLFGISEPNRVFANSLAYNLMLSLALTAEYKNQRPPRFINQQSGSQPRPYSIYRVTSCL